MSMYDYDTSPYVGYIIGFYDIDSEISSAKSHKKTIQLQFEGEYFDAPSGYNEYLTNLYGDYMTIPPEWQRKKNPHTYKNYWK